MGKATRLVRPRAVTGDGEGLVSRAGLAWLGEVADRSGLTAGLSQVLAGIPRRLFGPVPSRSSVQRAFKALGPAELRRDLRRGTRARGGMATRRSSMWTPRSCGPAATRKMPHPPTSGPTGITRWRRWWPRPEVLAGMFRPGNAGANCAADHVVVLTAAIEQLPDGWRAGHQPGDRPDLATNKLLVRTDSAGTSHWFATECRDRNIGFSLGYWIDGRVRDALLLVQEEDWQPAREAGGQVRDGAQVVEITDLVNLDSWPEGTV
jgi:hypothetical protein